MSAGTTEMMRTYNTDEREREREQSEREQRAERGVAAERE